jgi:hypothetical protein
LIGSVAGLSRPGAVHLVCGQHLHDNFSPLLSDPACKALAGMTGSET